MVSARAWARSIHAIIFGVDYKATYTQIMNAIRIFNGQSKAERSSWITEWVVKWIRKTQRAGEKKTHRMSSKKNNSKPGERKEWKEGGKTTTEWEKKTWILCDIKSWWNSVKDQLSDVNLLAKRWICLEWKLISRQKKTTDENQEEQNTRRKNTPEKLIFFLDMSKFLFCWRCASLIRLSDKIECRNGKRVYHIPSRDRIRNTIEIKKMKLKIMVTITKYSMLGVRSHKHYHNWNRKRENWIWCERDGIERGKSTKIHSI